MKLEITSCEGMENRHDAIEFTLLDNRGDLHTTRIPHPVFSKMVIDAMLNRAISREALGIELSNAAPYVTSGPKR